MRGAGAFAAVVVVAVALGGLVTLALGVPWASSAGSASPNGSLSCSVKASCTAGEVEVFRMSSLANAHAGTPVGSTYGNKVCCTGVSGLGTQCTGVYDVALTVSGPDNAHAASDGSYGTEVCLSGYGDDATADCAYTAGACDVGYACLATISGSTNAHVADCDGFDDYVTKVCCQATGDNCPETSNPGQENADSDQWGDACDNCPSTSTPWFVPVGDEDCDGWTTAKEGDIGTDPADACANTPDPNDEADDKWPPDFDDNRTIDIVDVLAFKPVFRTDVPPTSPRYDLFADGEINIVDVLSLKPFFRESCTP